MTPLAISAKTVLYLTLTENVLSKAILVEVRKTEHGAVHKKNKTKNANKAATTDAPAKNKPKPGTVVIPNELKNERCTFRFVIPILYNNQVAVAVITAEGDNEFLYPDHNSVSVYEIFKEKVTPLTEQVSAATSAQPRKFSQNGVTMYSIADLLGNVKGLDGEDYVRNGKILFDPTIIAWYQKGGTVDNHVVKGSIGWDDNQAVISFYKAGDSSTVIHESGHFFVENLANDVNSGKATEQEVKDWNTLLEYAGMTNEQWLAADVEGRRAAHEKFAEAFETYLMEGKAPSMELRNVFKRFSTWLKNVYSTIARNENAAPINDDVRKVFDRMLAAEEDIAEMERVNGYFAKLPSVITDNMSDSTKKRLEDVIQKAHDKAVEMLTREAMVNFTPERRAKIKAYKESIRADVEEQVHQRPLYTASEHIVEAIGEGRGTAKSWSKKYPAHFTMSPVISLTR